MGIGIIGVGGVARYAHLPAYRALGLPVAALCDVRQDVALEVAHEFHVDRIHETPEGLLEDPEVTVVDIATPPDSHVRLLTLAADAGKPALVQKPLCTSEPELQRILALREKGARVRLNMTGRHVSAWDLVFRLLRGGEIGKPIFCTIRNRDWWDREPGRWELAQEAFIIYEMVVHHLDLCLHWLGAPVSIAARGGIHPAQRIHQTNFVSLILDYGDGLIAQVTDDWTMPEFGFASGHPFEEVLITGERGVVRATSERVEFSEIDSDVTRVWHHPRPGQTLPGDVLEHNWFPDSFGVAMRAFLEDVAASRGTKEDWHHLEALSRLTLAAAEALRSDRWVAAGVDGTGEGAA